MDLNGKLIFADTINGHIGENNYTHILDDKYSKGVYLYSISNGYHEATQKMVVL